MPESLADTYENRLGEFKDLRHFYLGTTLFATGILLLVAGLVVATTDVLAGYYSTLELRRLGGVIGGIGIPAGLLGVFIVLPQNTVRKRSATALGVGLCLVGVVAFNFFYPSHWAGYGNDYTFFIIATYLAGTVLTFWSVFTAVVNFKTRNDPGGTVTVEVTRNGETHYVTVDRGEFQKHGAGAVGLLGETPDGNVETQTNRQEAQQSTQTSETKTSTDYTDGEWPDPGRGY